MTCSMKNIDFANFLAYFNEIFNIIKGRFKVEIFKRNSLYF